MTQRSTRGWRPLVALAMLSLFFIFPDQAHATTAGGTGGLPWETPLDTLATSIKGPVAFAISLLGLIGCGGMLIWGGEINEFLRRFIMLVLVISLLVFAANLLSNLFGVGAVIA